LKDIPASGNAFIYQVSKKTYKILNPSTFGKFATAYGIWQNAGPNNSLYTIVGGVEPLNEPGINVGYLVDYEINTGDFSHLRHYYYDNKPGVITHFEGITDYHGAYSLAAEGDPGAAFAVVYRNSDGSFGSAKWEPVKNPNTKENGISTGNSVLENNLIGIYEPSGGGIQSYVATVV
jgi:hypothetical protein